MRKIGLVLVLLCLGAASAAPIEYTPRVYTARGPVHYEPSFYVYGLVEGLQSEDLGERWPAASRIREDRRDLIEGLVQLAKRERQDQDPMVGPELDPKCQAVSLLGDIRAEEAIPTLLGLLDYKVQPRGGSLFETHGYGPTHPAAYALAKIGKPASKEALGLLARNSDPEKARSLVWVIVQVEGRELAEYLITQDRDRPRVDMERENVSRALGYIGEMAGK